MGKRKTEKFFGKVFLPQYIVKQSSDSENCVAPFMTYDLMELGKRTVPRGAINSIPLYTWSGCANESVLEKCVDGERERCEKERN